MASINGRCLCERIRYAANVEPISVTHCHCTMCQRASGGPFVTWVTFHVRDLTWTPSAPRYRRSSTFAERGFCPECGSAITMRYDAEPHLIAVSRGTLDDPERVTATRHIWCKDALPDALADDGLPRHETWATKPGGAS